MKNNAQMYEFFLNTHLEKYFFCISLSAENANSMMTSYHTYRAYCLYWILLVPVFSLGGKVADITPTKADIESQVWLYLVKADSCIRTYNLEQAKRYLDFAAIHEKRLENMDVLGLFYSKHGDYYSLQFNELEAHKNYYKAIECYEKTGRTKLLLQIYQNLTIAYFQKG